MGEIIKKCYKCGFKGAEDKFCAGKNQCRECKKITNALYRNHGTSKQDKINKKISRRMHVVRLADSDSMIGTMSATECYPVRHIECQPCMDYLYGTSCRTEPNISYLQQQQIDKFMGEI